MSLAAVFEYHVDPAATKAFEAVYGSDGERARYEDGARNEAATRLWLRERVPGRFETG